MAPHLVRALCAYKDLRIHSFHHHTHTSTRACTHTHRHACTHTHTTKETYDATSNGRGWKKAVVNMHCGAAQADSERQEPASWSCTQCTRA